QPSLTKTPPTYPFQSLLYNPYSLFNDHPVSPETSAPAPPVNGLIRRTPYPHNPKKEEKSKKLQKTLKKPKKSQKTTDQTA
ncbi:hypothetical protein, partial [Bombella favorum]|uniref:hypothetical protein n=1 Tax=Bombella favorum TaxID=2039164 RepID=UPI001E524616